MGSGLTPRELDVLRLTAELGIKGAAYRLGIAENTARVHRARAYAKLDVSSQAEAHRALGWLRLPGGSTDGR